MYASHLRHSPSSSLHHASTPARTYLVTPTFKRRHLAMMISALALATIGFTSNVNAVDLNAGETVISDAGQIGGTLNVVNFGGDAKRAENIAIKDAMKNLNSSDVTTIIRAIAGARAVSGLPTVTARSNRHLMFSDNGRGVQKLTLASGKAGSFNLQRNSRFTLDTFDYPGSPITLNNGVFILTSVAGGKYLFSKNVASGNSGYPGVFDLVKTGGGALYVENALFSLNQASDGGVAGLGYDSVATFFNSNFVENSALNGGSAFNLLDGSTLNIVDSSFYHNDGSTIALRGDTNRSRKVTLRQWVSDDKTSYYVSNKADDQDVASLWFSGPQEDSTIQYQLTTGNNAKLVMLDRMVGQAKQYNAIVISKSGAGTWQLAGASTFSTGTGVKAGTLSFSINDGTLELMAASAPGGETITLPEGVALSDGSSSFKHKYDAGSISFDDDNNATFKIASGATLKVDGGNTISGGTLDFSGKVAFDLLSGWQKETGQTITDNPVLTLSGSKIFSPENGKYNSLGTGGIDLLTGVELRNGVYTLVASDVDNALTDTYTLFLNGDAYTSGDVSSEGMTYELVVDSNKKWLQLIVSGNDFLVWNNTTGKETWDNASMDWVEEDEGTGRVFGDGKKVGFTPDHAGEVTVVAGGVKPSLMVVETEEGSDYTFVGGKITANKLVKSNAGTVTFDNDGNTFSRIEHNGGVIAVSNAMQLGTSLDKLIFDGDATEMSAITDAIQALGSGDSLSDDVDNIRSTISDARDAGSLPTLVVVAGESLTPDGSSGDSLSVAANKAGAFHLGAGSAFTLDSSAMTAPGTSPIMLADGAMLTLTADEGGQYVFRDNKSQNHDGSVFSVATGGTLYVEKALFENNNAGSNNAAVFLDGASVATFVNSDFVGNITQGRASAISLTNTAVVNLIDTSFYKNNFSPSDGGAIALDNATLKQWVSAGQTSYYAGNKSVNGPTNGLTFGGASTYQLTTGEDATLVMLDPIFYRGSGTVAINKAGAGTWELAGASNLSAGAANFIISEGTLKLLAANAVDGRDIELPDKTILNHRYVAGSIAFNTTSPDTSTFTVADGAVLVIEGGNAINGGTLAIEGEMQFDVGSATGTTTTPWLAVASAVPTDKLLGNGLVRIVNAEHLAPTGSDEAITLCLIQATNGGRLGEEGDLYIGATEEIAHTPIRNPEAGEDLMYGLVVSDDDRYLDLVIADASMNGGLVWSGPDGGMWDVNQSGNWEGDVEGIDVNTFLHGDDVTFDVSTQGHTVVVDEDGVRVKNMSVKADHAFTGGVINAETVDVSNNAKLGLAIEAQPSLQTGTLTFGTGAGLDLSGLSLNAEQLGQAWTVVKSENAVTGFDPANVTIMGQQSVNFLSATPALSADSKEVQVTPTLSWYNPNSNQAHGSFTLQPDKTFVLDVVLADNTNTASHDPQWDGKQLTKDGDGTLVLAANNTYSGLTHVKRGVLQIGNSGTTGMVAGDVVNKGVLRFARSDNATYSGSISGTGELEKVGDGELTLSGDHSFTGGTHVVQGTLTVSGSLASQVGVASAAGLSLRGSVNDQVTLAPQATLNVYKGATMQQLSAAGSEVGFFLPTDVVNGETLAQVSGNAMLDSANVRLGIDGGVDLPRLNNGDKVMLLRAGSLSTQGTAYKTAQIGSTLAMDVAIGQEGNDLVANFLSATTRAVEGTKSLAEGQITGMAMLQQAGDLVVERGLSLAASAGNNNRPLESFGTIEGVNQKVNTGSHIKLKGYNVLTGVAYNHVNGAGGHITGGAYLEYGHADLDTFNNFASGTVLGDGKTEYVGGGLMGRYQFANGFYGESVLRVGNIKTKYHTSDLNFQGIDARFDSSARYWGVALTGGKLLPVSDKISLDFYARVHYTHQGDDSVKLSTGERLAFDAQSSTRTRIGTKVYRYLGLEKQSLVYAGVAYEHQFSSKLEATTAGKKIEAPELKGGTGILDVGVHYRPSAQSPVALDFSVQGYAGKRKGVSGTLKVNVMF